MKYLSKLLWFIFCLPIITLAGLIAIVRLILSLTIGTAWSMGYGWYMVMYVKVATLIGKIRL